MTTYRILAQRNTAWAYTLLGNSPTSTIGQYGCLLCCYAMLANADPLATQAALLKVRGFAPGSAMMATPFIPQIIDNWQARYCGISGWYNDPVPDDKLAQLLIWLDAGNPAILLVDPTPGNPGLHDDEMHFVLAVRRDGNDIIIHDPWFGTEGPLCPRYGTTPATAIYQWRYYTVEETDPKA